jgi:hypothetical protein
MGKSGYFKPSDADVKTDGKSLHPNNDRDPEKIIV